ncbi:DUF4227 family protein [Paenibacillus psychroresistens]|uniref:DUF4227 family protein n=1 Tax=Paenibacillus psychroresistens TaxID=1778678 RepID=A0A6B8RKM6_9BACL|nr:DUF4227 family protein [Paenibacillus psychroresistens]QGQ95976.1 DUF4227 family protein [Paenibacillus psychroresistens]
MVFSFRKFKRRLKFLLQLFILTVLFYYSLNLVTRWIEPVQKYRTPSGHSVKVFQEEMLIEQRQTIKDRLAMFYWIGE